MRRIAGPSSLLPAPSLRRLRDRVVSRRRHRVSSHNGLRAPLFEPPKLAAPRSRCRCRCNKFAPGPLAPRAGPGCVPAWPARWRGARPPPTSPRGAAPGRPGRPPTTLPHHYPSTVYRVLKYRTRHSTFTIFRTTLSREPERLQEGGRTALHGLRSVSVRSVCPRGIETSHGSHASRFAWARQGSSRS